MRCCRESCSVYSAYVVGFTVYCLPVLFLLPLPGNWECSPYPLPPTPLRLQLPVRDLNENLFLYVSPLSIHLILSLLILRIVFSGQKLYSVEYELSMTRISNGLNRNDLSVSLLNASTRFNSESNPRYKYSFTINDPGILGGFNINKMVSRESGLSSLLLKHRKLTGKKNITC